MRSTIVAKRIKPSARTARVSQEAEPALRVVTVYQDPLTRHWATELWDRVGALIGQGGICCHSWKIGELTEPQVFTHAVQAAAEADVLVISVRDAGDLPVNLYVWIDAWMPRRAGLAGALVALIGVPGQPDAQAGRAHQYLESVARRVGVDFLPRERKLPESSGACSSLAGSTRAPILAFPWPAGIPSLGAGAPLRWGLTE